MGYTKFGKLVRKEMIDHDENLSTLAQLLDVSTSFVSAVITGIKSVPDNWVDELTKHYDLKDYKYEEFYDAYLEDKKNIRIDIEDAPISQKNLAIQFQRRLPQLDEKEIKSILHILGEK